MKRKFKNIVVLFTISVFLLCIINPAAVYAAEIRYNGDSRISTALKIAMNGWPDKADYAVIAAADDKYLIDSLIASPLAKSYDAPILLNYKGDKLDSGVSSALKLWNVKNVFIVSSDKVLGSGIENELKASGITVKRVGKSTPRETALNIAACLKEKTGIINEAFLVSEDSSHLVDALSIASVAGMKGMPILLTSANTLPADVKSFISDNKISKCYAIGGKTLISDSILNEVKGTRLFGNDRYNTNVEVLKQFKDIYKMSSVFFSSGEDGHLVDALAGSVLAAKKSAPILLVGSDLNTDAKQYIKNNINKKSSIQIFGGNGAVSAAVEKVIDASVYGEESGLLSVGYADAMGSYMVAAVINHRVNSADRSQFKVTGESGENVGIKSVETAPWDKKGRTVLLTLDSPVSSGKTYYVNSVPFDGADDLSDSPTVTGVESGDYNIVDVTFSQPVRLDGINLKITGSDGSKLYTSSMSYVEGNPCKVEVITSEQKSGVTYYTEISGAKDFLNRTMTADNSRTFTGSGKDSETKPVISDAKALSPKTILATFNTNVNPSNAGKVSGYSITEEYASDSRLPIESVRMADENDAGIDGMVARKSVLITLSEPMKDATLYKLTASGIVSTAGVNMDNGSSGISLIGISPFASKMEMNDDGNRVYASGNKKVRITFKRHMDTDFLIPDNFVISKVEDNSKLNVKFVKVIDDKNVELMVNGMDKVMYKLTVRRLLDIDGNSFEDNKNSVIFQGADVPADLSAITSAKLQDDNITLLLAFNSEVGSNAKDAARYVIDNGVGNPEKAELVSGKPNMVKLTIPTTITGKTYKITVTGLKNSAGIASAKTIYSTFTGAGASADTPVIKSVSAVDSHTLHVLFDRSVKDSSIDGSSKIWLSGGSIFNSGAFIIHGRTDKAMDPGANVYVCQSPENESMLIVKSRNADFTSSNADSSGNFTLKVKGADPSGKTVFRCNNNDIQPITISRVTALNKITIRVDFNQPVRIEDSAVLGWVTNSKQVADYIKVSGGASSNVMNLTKPTLVDGTYTSYNFVISGGNLWPDNWLVVNPSAAALLNSVHDYTKPGVKGFVTLADESPSEAGIQQVREFDGSTAEPGSISSIPVTMSDCKTIEISYPEAMYAVNGSSSNSVLNISNYKLVDKNNNEIGSNYLSTHICNIAYDNSGNRVILSLNTSLPPSDNGYYIQFANTIQNVLGTKYVKNAQGSGTKVVSQFSLSLKQAAKLSISPETAYDVSSRTLAIKLDQKAASLFKYDLSVLLSDFKITVIDSDGMSYNLKGDDIQGIKTDISDSYSTASDMIYVTLKSKINGTKTLKSGAEGKVQLISSSTLRAVNGETADPDSYSVFTQ